MIAMSLKFSTRTAWDTRETELALLLAGQHNSGLPLLDLTASNPTQCGFTYDEPSILSALAQPDTLTYDPNPRGMPAARQAVAAYYADHGVHLNVDDILL